MELLKQITDVNNKIKKWYINIAKKILEERLEYLKTTARVDS